MRLYGNLDQSGLPHRYELSVVLEALKFKHADFYSPNRLNFSKQYPLKEGMKIPEILVSIDSRSCPGDIGTYFRDISPLILVNFFANMAGFQIGEESQKPELGSEILFSEFKIKGLPEGRVLNTSWGIDMTVSQIIGADAILNESVKFTLDRTGKKRVTGRQGYASVDRIKKEITKALAKQY